MDALDILEVAPLASLVVALPIALVALGYAAGKEGVGQNYYVGAAVLTVVSHVLLLPVYGLALQFFVLGLLGPYVELGDFGTVFLALGPIWVATILVIRAPRKRERSLEHARRLEKAGGPRKPKS